VDDSNPSVSVPPALARIPFVFVRHGQTHWNVEGRMQGHSNRPRTRLTAEGIAQATAAGHILKAAGSTFLVSSGSARAQQTAAIIQHVTGAALRGVEGDLIERGFGKYESLDRDELLAALRRDNPGEHIPDLDHFEQHFHRLLPSCAESNQALLARVIPALNHWNRRAARLGRQAAFVSHGAVYRVLGEHLVGGRVTSRNGVPFLFNPGPGGAWTITEMESRA
jgi:probable phosphoglycerate mutase